MKRVIGYVFILMFVVSVCNAGTGRLKVVDRGIYEIPDNRDWKEHYVEAEQNSYLGTDFIGEYDSTSKIVIGYIVSDKGSSAPCADYIFGSIDDSRDACYQYVQLSYRIVDGKGYIRIDRVCVNPTSTGKTLSSLIGNKIEWVLIQTGANCEGK